MKLNEFKALVDAAPAPTDCTQTAYDTETEKALLAEIRRCFTRQEGERAFAAISNIVSDLGLRSLCDHAIHEPYFGVTTALRQALRDGGSSESTTSDWRKAVELAKLHEACATRLPDNQLWIGNHRVCAMSAAITGLRAKGYQVDLPDTGDVEIPEVTIGKLSAEINKLAASLGSSLAMSASYGLSKVYLPVLGRYDLGRQGPTLQLSAEPELPLAYLYQLGVRYFQLKPSAKEPQATLSELCELVRLATALLDLTSTAYEMLFAGPSNVIDILQKYAVYDSVFLVTQAKPAHAQEYLSWMLSNQVLAKCADKEGRTVAEVHRMALILFNETQRANSHGFTVIDSKEIANALGIPNAKAISILLAEVFAHKEGANQKLSFPPKNTDIDAAFRPLLLNSGKFFMQPGPMAASAIVNAVLDWCRKNVWPNNRFDDKVLGPLFEQFVREKFASKGVVVRGGSYSCGAVKGECDVVVETPKEIIFIELKSKMLSRQARAGDTIKALDDLSQALVKPQAQAMERCAVLVENGTLSLTFDGKSHVINLGGREVFKVSLTRGDLGSLHDRIFIGRFMRLGCRATFHPEDLTRQKELEGLHHQFQRLKSSAERAKDDYLNTSFPFSRSWSFSVYHLLMLLDRTIDNESFSRELQRTRWMTTERKDFFAEYAYALELEKHKVVKPGQHVDAPSM